MILGPPVAEMLEIGLALGAGGSAPLARSYG